MTQNGDAADEPFTDSVPDHDQSRLVGATQMVAAAPGQPPYPAAERILRIEIPVEFEWTKQNAHWELALSADDSRQAEADLDPCGYLPVGELNDDDRLTRLLSRTPTINGPGATGTGRQLLNIDQPLLATILDSQHAPAFDAPSGSHIDRLQRLVDAHERNHELTGSHAHTLLDPDSRSVSTRTTTYDFCRTLIPSEPIYPPFRSVIYNEVCALVAERRAHPDLVTHLALDRHRRATGRTEYSLALDILEFLHETHRLSYDQIASLLDAASYAPLPMAFLAAALYDLQTGMALDQIYHHGSHFDFYGNSPDEYYNQKDELLQYDDELSFPRLFQHTVETVTLEGRTLVKEWWLRDPPDVVPPMLLRLILFGRRLTDHTRHHYDQPLIPTTNPGDNLTTTDGKIIAGLPYQDPGNSLPHPYRAAMAGDDQWQQGMYIQDDAAARYKDYWRRVSGEVGRGEFADGEAFTQWLTGAAPVDQSPSDAVRWYQ